MIEAQIQTAGTLVSSLNRDLIAAAAARRQGVGRSAGDRGAPSLAAGPVELIEIEERAPGRLRSERVTDPGSKTAARRVSSFLARYGREDGRRLAAGVYAAAVERVGSVKGFDFSEGSEISSGAAGVSDGGATSRVRDAALLRSVRGKVNRWRWSRARRCYVTGPSRVVLAPRRGSSRRPITAIELLDGIVVEGLSLAEILRRSGWSVQAIHRRKLTDSAEEMIEDLADIAGLSARVSRS